MTKGALRVIMELFANAAEVSAAVDITDNGFSARGLYSLRVARADGDGAWQFTGVLPMFDPPREQAKATIATASHMGLSVKMVTGDALAIARETSGKPKCVKLDLVRGNLLGNSGSDSAISRSH